MKAMIRYCIGLFVSFSCLFFSNTLVAETYPHHRFYQNGKSYAMGGTGIVQDDSLSAVLSNPANLRNPPTKGIEGEVFGVVLGVSNDLVSFASAWSNALVSGTNLEKTKKLLQALNDFTGGVMSVKIDMTPVVVIADVDSNIIDAQSIGAVSSFMLNTRTHSGLGSAGFLEVSGLNYNGIVFGMTRYINSITLGINLKLLGYMAMQEEYTLVELADKKLPDKVLQNDLKLGISLASDIGLIWKVLKGNGWDVETGMVINNIGGIGNAKLKSAFIPMTIDLGAKVKYEMTSYNSISFVLDYLDIGSAYSDKGDFNKRLNYGLDLRFFYSDYIDIGLQAGMHQSQNTYGGNVILFDFMHVGYASYSEEFGVYAGQDPSRRNIVYFSLSF